MPRLASLRHPLPRRARRHPARRSDGDRRARLGGAWRCRDAVRRLDDRPAVTSRITLDLVADGAVRLALDRSLYSLAERWIPQGLGQPRGVSARATISVRASRAPLRRPTEPATLALDRVAAWVDQGHATAVLRGAAPSSGGLLSLAAGRGRMQGGPAGGGAGAAREPYSLLTLSAAVLLARLQRAPVHAAPGVAPGGPAWLLPGGA